ncbi:hypothetical protein GCM10022221_38320 [Actinocorallia aurea]
MTELTPTEGGPAYVLGVGARRGVSFQEVDSLVLQVLAEAGVRGSQVIALATVEAKAREPALRALAANRGWNMLIFPAATLARVHDAQTSETVLKAVGTPSVAEAAALLGAAGPHVRDPCGAPRAGERGKGRKDLGGGVLVVPKRRSVRATVALARVREEKG